MQSDSSSIPCPQPLPSSHPLHSSIVCFCTPFLQAGWLLGTMDALTRRSHSPAGHCFSAGKGWKTRL